MYYFNHYVVDWDKVKTQEDIVIILKELNIGVEQPSEEFKKIAKYVNKESGRVVTDEY